MGQHSTAVAVDRVAIEGRHDTSATSLDGYNLVNGILYAGELAHSSTAFDYDTLKVTCAGPEGHGGDQGKGITVVGCHTVTTSAPGHAGSPGGR